jgi:hypothetical protein
VKEKRRGQRGREQRERERSEGADQIHKQFGESLDDEFLVVPFDFPFLEKGCRVLVGGRGQLGVHHCDQVVQNGVRVPLVHLLGPVEGVALNAHLEDQAGAVGKGKGREREREREEKEGEQKKRKSAQQKEKGEMSMTCRKPKIGEKKKAEASPNS